MAFRSATHSLFTVFQRSGSIDHREGHIALMPCQLTTVEDESGARLFLGTILVVISVEDRGGDGRCEGGSVVLYMASREFESIVEVRRFSCCWVVF